MAAPSSSSPAPSTPPPPRRAAFTYGRRKDLSSSEALPDTSAAASSDPDSSITYQHDDERVLGPMSSASRPPSSEAPDIDTSMDMDDREDSDDDEADVDADANAGDALASKFQFSWKKDLKRIDNDESSGEEEEDAKKKEHPISTGASAKTSTADANTFIPRNILAADIPLSSQPPTQPTSPSHAQQQHRFDNNIFGGGSDLTTLLDSSSQPQPSQSPPRDIHDEEGEPRSPVPQTRRRLTNRIPDSDDEEDDARLNLSIDTKSSLTPYPINTPSGIRDTSRSPSGSPPTSPSSDILSPSMGTRKRSYKGKGKAKETVFAPSQFDIGSDREDDSQQASGSSKRARGALPKSSFPTAPTAKSRAKPKTKVKPPTKKSLAQTNLERARFAAQQQPSIARENEPLRLSDFWTRLAKQNPNLVSQASTAPQQPAIPPPCSQSSDPIENWSSPAYKPSAGTAPNSVDNNARGVKRLQPEESLIISTSSPSRDIRSPSKRSPFRELKSLPSRATATFAAATTSRNALRVNRAQEVPIPTLDLTGGPPSSDEEGDLPTVGEVTRLAQQKEQARQEDLKARQRLLEIKRKALADAEARKKKHPTVEVSDDDDDDLQIVSEGGVDMHTVADKEAEDRKARKYRHERVSEGRKRQMTLAGVRESSKPGGASKNGAAKASSPETKKNQARQKLRKDDLMGMLKKRIEEENRTIDADKREEWVRRGGAIKTDVAMGETGVSLEEAKRRYGEMALKVLEEKKAGMEEYGDEDEDEGDEDWVPPASERGSASPPPDEEASEKLIDDDATMLDTLVPSDNDNDEELDGKENLKPSRSKRTKARILVDSDTEEDNENENAAPVGHRVLAPNSSFIQNQKDPVLLRQQQRSPSPFGDSLPPSPTTRLLRRGTTNSTGDRTDDEVGKESSNEDKENKAVAARLPVQRRLSLSLSPAAVPPPAGSLDDDDLGLGPLSNHRRPFNELPGDDEEDPFASPSFRNASTPSFAERLQNSSPERTLIDSASQIPLSASVVPKFGPQAGGRGLSQFMDDDDDDENENASPTKKRRGGAFLQPSFSDEFGKGVLDKLADPFSDEENIGAAATSKLRGANEVQFTQDSQQDALYLEPALQLSESKRRRAEMIFDKEQEYILEQAAKQTNDSGGGGLWYNNDGFLTQHKPKSPVIPPSPAFSLFGPTQPGPGQTPTLTSSERRDPLRTLSFSNTDFPQDASPLVEMRPLGRIRRRADSSSREASPSPSKPLNVFDVMLAADRKKRQKEKKERERLGRSEFVENEAQESDEDEQFGFGLGKKEDDDEEDDNDDLDKTVEGLVDDAEMDEETKAKELVLEKVREHQEVDDARDEKIARDAVEGKLRVKRRSGNVGFDESDDEDDEDDNAARIRRKMAKRRRIGGDLDKLAQHEKTLAFVESYNKTFQDDDEDNEFAYLQNNGDGGGMPVEEEEDRADDDEGPPEEVDIRDIHDQIRQAAKRGEFDEQPMDPHDLSWLDDADSDGEAHVRVKAVTRKQPVRRGNPSQLDLDDVPETSRGPGQNDREILQNRSWMKTMNQTRNTGTGRGGVMSAVTGHTKKVKTGGSISNAGSHKQGARGGLARQSASGDSASSASRAKPAKAPSLLAGLKRNNFQ